MRIHISTVACVVTLAASLALTWAPPASHARRKRRPSKGALKKLRAASNVQRAVGRAGRRGARRQSASPGAPARAPGRFSRAKAAMKAAFRGRRAPQTAPPPRATRRGAPPPGALLKLKQKTNAHLARQRAAQKAQANPANSPKRWQPGRNSAPRSSRQAAFAKGPKAEYDCTCTWSLLNQKYTITPGDKKTTTRVGDTRYGSVAAHSLGEAHQIAVKRCYYAKPKDTYGSCEKGCKCVQKRRLTVGPRGKVLVPKRR